MKKVKMMNTALVAALVSSVGFASNASAAVTIYNTDTAHWTVAESTAAPTGGSYGTFSAAIQSSIYPAGYITWSGTAGGNGPGGYYTYQTTITASQANDTLNFKYSVDDSLIAIYIDNVLATATGLGGTYTGYTNASITGIGLGSHTIDFVTVNNYPASDPRSPNPNNPVAFSLAAVPEPTTWAMMIAGFGFIGMALRRRRESVRVTYA